MARLGGRFYFFPVEIFEGIGGRGHIRLESQKAKSLLGLKGDVGIDKQKMGGALNFHKGGHDVLSCLLDKVTPVRHQECQGNSFALTGFLKF